MRSPNADGKIMLDSIIDESHTEWVGSQVAVSGERSSSVSYRCDTQMATHSHTRANYEDGGREAAGGKTMLCIQV